MKKQKMISTIMIAVFVIVCALGISIVMLLIAHKDVGLAFSKLAQGAVGNKMNFARTVRMMAPLIMLALTFSVAIRGQMFNAGGQGQFYLGAVCATAVSLLFPTLPGWLLIILGLIAGMAGGMLWALIPAVLKVRFRCSEVVTTLMFNYIAVYFTEFLVRVPFYVPGAVGESGSTANIPEGVSLTTLVKGSELTTEIIFALVITAIVWYWSRWTVSGYETEVVGVNSIAARYTGVNVKSRQLLAMAISGAIAGAGGALEIIGVFHRFVIDFAPSVGFDGIVVSLMAGNAFPLIPVTAFFLSCLQSGAKTMEMFGKVPRSLVDVMIGVIIVVVTVKRLPFVAKGTKKTVKESKEN